MALHPHATSDAVIATDPLFTLDGAGGDVPRDRIPDGPSPAEMVRRLITGELSLDGSATQNLATFVTTWMEPEAHALMDLAADKNMIDKDEYPMTAEIERRCVAILSDLWHAPSVAPGGGGAVGCSTTGSSEAAMLGGLALKRRWRARRRAAGLDDSRPNIVMGANVQVCWDKFANYFDVEPRLVPVEGGRLHLDGPSAAAHVDESTIGVVAILGSTFDGSYEPVAEIARALDDLAASGGPDVPVHVDAASGGFVAPFIDPDLAWDFRLPRVTSINSSGHKYGRVFPGVGWAVWRDADALPEDLVFRVSYLGGDMPTFALNFSRPGSQVVAQYYNLLRLGREGYRLVQQSCRDVARYVSSEVAATDGLDLVSDGSQLPVFAFTTTADAGFTVYQLSETLRSRGWQVPAYPMPPDREDLHVCRVVVRNGVHDMAALFVRDLRACVADLVARSGAAAPAAQAPAAGFHH